VVGTKARAFAPLPPVSLEDLVPPDHFYRHLERSLDLGFVRDLVRGAYADTGRPSIDPVVFFKLQLVLFVEGLRSERQLMRAVAARLSLRWYLGYDLAEPLPDHSGLARTRDRYRLAVFRRFFEAIVERCVRAGLAWGRELSVDAAKVAANAALDSLRPRFAVEAHLARLFAAAGEEETPRQTDDASVEEDGAGAPASLPVTLTEAARTELAQIAAIRHDRIGEAGRPNRGETSGAYRRTADSRASATDRSRSPSRPRAFADLSRSKGQHPRAVGKPDPRARIVRGGPRGVEAGVIRHERDCDAVSDGLNDLPRS
jgi:transposase